MSNILHVPSPITALHTTGSFLFAGSEDGILRAYDVKSRKVAKALRLSSEIASVVTSPSDSPGNLPEIWVTCGKQLIHCNMDSPKMILSVEDAMSVTDLSPEDDDVLNEIRHDGTYIAFSLDSGRVGVLDAHTLDKRIMSTKHQSICGTLNFIPSRDGELLSAGYDQTLYHHNFFSSALISSSTITNRDNGSEISLSPPFIICTAIASNGTVAAGTADGRIWFGFGAVCKPAKGQRKGAGSKSQAWGGLRKRESACVAVAEGPIVAMLFKEDSLVYSTMLGSVRQCTVSLNEEDIVTNKWVKSTSVVEKVNSLSILGTLIYVGGVTKEGKGAIEILELES